MKVIFVALPLISLTFQAQAQSWNFDDVGQYMKDKGDQAEQYVRDNKSDNSSNQQQGTSSQAGQVGVPFDAGAIVPDGVFPDQGGASQGQAKGGKR